MRSAFPNAAVTGFHDDLIDAMTTDPKDRHVAAAADRGNAALIVTRQPSRLPTRGLGAYDIEAVHPTTSSKINWTSPRSDAAMPAAAAR